MDIRKSTLYSRIDRVDEEERFRIIIVVLSSRLHSMNFYDRICYLKAQVCKNMCVLLLK